jgi:hypothetical protein
MEHLIYITSIIVLILINMSISYILFKVVKGYTYYVDNMHSFLREVTTFKNHLHKVYNMDTFCGDPTLKNLLEHTKDLKEYCDDFTEDLFLDDELIEQVEDIEQDDSNSQHPEDEA